nr:hypothetical protein [uncultured Cellulosilyticum sp.]
MNKNGLGEEGIFIKPNLEGEENKIIFNGEEILVKGKKVCKKAIRHHMQKEEEDGFKKKHKKDQMNGKNHYNGKSHYSGGESNAQSLVQSLDRSNQNERFNNEVSQDNQDIKQTTVRKDSSSIIAGDEITPSQMRKAIVWAEILGKPVCKMRRNRKQGRR